MAHCVLRGCTSHVHRHVLQRRVAANAREPVYHTQVSATAVMEQQQSHQNAGAATATAVPRACTETKNGIISGKDVLFAGCDRHRHTDEKCDWVAPTPNPDDAAKLNPHIDMTHLCVRPADVTLVVAHGPCHDGFAAAVAAWLAFPTIRVVFTTPEAASTHVSQHVRGEVVLFLDVAPRDPSAIATWGMANWAVLDHHESSEEALSAVDQRHKVFSLRHSGAVLAWQFFHPNTPLPLLYRAIQARDTWRKHEFANCDEFLSAFHASTNLCAACWAPTLVHYAEPSPWVSNMLVIGRTVERVRQNTIQAYVRNAARRIIVPAAHTQQQLRLVAWVVNCPDRAVLSDVGNALVRAEGHAADIALMFAYDTRESAFNVSLRSLDPNGPDVARYAATFPKGGGHKHAAGFTYHGASIEDLFVAPPVAMQV